VSIIFFQKLFEFAHGIGVDIRFVPNESSVHNFSVKIRLVGAVFTAIFIAIFSAMLTAENRHKKEKRLQQVHWILLYRYNKKMNLLSLLKY